MNDLQQVFNLKFTDDELANEFYQFFDKNGLGALFTDGHRTSDISVSYLDAKSVVNDGSYHNTLKEFTDYMAMASGNKAYQEAMFKIIHTSRSFQALMNNIKKVMRFIDSQIDDQHLFNTWNIVFYNKELL